MTIKEYLKEYLVRGDNIPNTDIETWFVSVPSKGRVTVEYTPEFDKADIAHETINRRVDYYVAVNIDELKNTIEYCIGPIVSDNQWHCSQDKSEDDLDQLDY